MSEIQGLRRRTWAEIDLDALRHNYVAVRKALLPRTKLCCVIKADAYGHGATRLASYYEALGADFLAVSNLEEALQVRAHGVRLPILILGYTPEECAETLARHNISQTVYSFEYGMKLADHAHRAGVRLKIHIKLDTGMGRIGFLSRREGFCQWDEVLSVCRRKAFLPEGIFSHFATADQGAEGDLYVRQQFDLFSEAVSYLEREGVHFELRHFANSAAIFDHPDFHLDMVRAGIVLYGLPSSDQMRRLPPLVPAMAWKTVISHCKTLYPEETVSYGRSFRADREMRIATVPVGYADGFWRQNQQKGGCLTVNGRNAPIVGRICMDQLMLDVTDIPCEIGDVATIFGMDGKGAQTLARENGTICYEILCAIGTRVPRFYLQERRVVGCLDCVYSEDLDKE